MVKEKQDQNGTERTKTCFVIMPISDQDGYAPGHFGRVYEHLIKPACKAAGFEPIRADDIKRTNFIVVDIIQQILNADMAICDLSSRNPNVFYELGIRQAFNKPVTLIKDIQTNRAFDVQGFKDIEYDESLRVDNVGRQIEAIAEDLANTYAEKDSGNVNSIVGLLGITVAKAPERKEILPDTQLILDAIQDLRLKVAEVERQGVYKSARQVIGNKSFNMGVFSYGLAEGLAKTLGTPMIDSIELVAEYLMNYDGDKIPTVDDITKWLGNRFGKLSSPPNSISNKK